MLPVVCCGTEAPTFVFMHFLAGSAREWEQVTELLAPIHECVALDLPGFGAASARSGFSVEDMAGEVTSTLKELKLLNYVLVGHSMSGKLALVLAARKIKGLKGLVLVAPSPPSPEPIKKSNRKKMLAMPRDRQSAEGYLDGMTVKPLSGDLRESAVNDFLRTSPEAWKAWLRYGSEEDWATRVGLVDCPTLVITGELDPSLHATAQKRLTIPHLRRSRLEIIAGCGHLPTVETPKQLSVLLSDFTRRKAIPDSDQQSTQRNSHG